MSAKDNDRLIGIVASQPWLMSVLIYLERSGPPNGCIGAGCVAASVWNRLTDRTPLWGVKDVDIAYFNPDQLAGEAEESELSMRLSRAFPEVQVPFDVKNQARVHLWYERRFGCPITPYRSLEHAISTWPTTATSVGVALRNGRLQIIAPFGLKDLLGHVVRPNRAQVTREIYEAKVARWTAIWPELRVHPWSGVGDHLFA